MTKDEALKLALETLECWQRNEDCNEPMSKILEAIKEALAQPEQCQCPNCKVTLHASDCAVHSGPAYPAGWCDCGAQPEQEPVAWEQFYPDIGKPQIEFAPVKIVGVVAPQRTWVGLTDEEQQQAYEQWQNEGWGVFYNAIEAKLKEKNT